MTHWRRTALPLLVAASLPACAVGPDTSYVAQLQEPEDAQVLATGMAELVVMQLPAASSTLVLTPTSSDQSGNAFTKAFASALRRRGFAVAEDRQPVTTSAHRIRYLVTPLDNGDLARMTIDDSTEGSRFFVRNTAGGLQAGGPFTVTQAEPAR
ncbi:hypothetical protein [Limobrevibacterium gyesilva]|uniref:Conjugal transfer protein TrbH n=1 Tax=Limobrevibacterium gyesilva TaxID=2991712 RepID=A0AA41YSE0_9PROT|nr:hypothetical protein [Limobrevibacterium gyesilva]MCW3477682.1 hypothetical protein [Limobrevibacterium gyesilva]